MELFGEVMLPWLKQRQNYGFVLYDLGDVWKSAYQNSGSVLLMLVGKAVSRLDASPHRQVPDELLFAMNPAEILALYAGYSILVQTPGRLTAAINKPHFWQVVSGTCNAAFTRPDVKPALNYLGSIDRRKGKPYLVSKMSLQERLRQLPTGVAAGFMEVFTQEPPLPEKRPEQLSFLAGGKTLDAFVFEHFEGRYKRWQEMPAASA